MFTLLREWALQSTITTCLYCSFHSDLRILLNFECFDDLHEVMWVFLLTLCYKVFLNLNLCGKLQCFCEPDSSYQTLFLSNYSPSHVHSFQWWMICSVPLSIHSGHFHIIFYGHTHNISLWSFKCRKCDKNWYLEVVRPRVKCLSMQTMI